MHGSLGYGKGTQETGMPADMCKVTQRLAYLCHRPLSPPSVNAPRSWLGSGCHVPSGLELPTHSMLTQCCEPQEGQSRGLGEFLDIFPERGGPQLVPEAPSFSHLGQYYVGLNCPLISPEDNRGSEMGWNQYRGFQ